MTKLRKMLGDINAPVTLALMRQIETQSHITLVRWAVAYVRRHCLPIFQAYAPENPIYDNCIADCKTYRVIMESGLRDHDALKAIKESIKDARTYAASVKDPAAQAAARAISTACAVITTPTNALGFTFYAAAAEAYHTLGTDASDTAYDTYTKNAMQKMRNALIKVSVPDEPHPVKINWHC